MKINIIRGILILLLAGTFFLIFGFSSQNATESSGISKKVSEAIVEITNKNDTVQEKNKIVKMLEPIIRKLAHFSIYTVVGFLLMTLCFTYKIDINKAFLLEFALVILYIKSVRKSYTPKI